MSLLAQVMLWVFITAWCVAAGAFFYGNRYFLPMWAAGFKKRPQHEGYWRKVFIALAVFIGAFVVEFAAGGIAELAGGWAPHT